jgi:NB-ARC domain
LHRFGLWFCVVLIPLIFSYYARAALGINLAMKTLSQDRVPITNFTGQQTIVPSPATHFMVPYEKNELFVGRNGLLSDIFEKLNDAKERQYNHRVALYGMGGVGKTQTVLAYVYSMKTFYSSIFWISGADQGILLDGFQKIAIEVGDRRLISDSTQEETAKRVLAWLASQPKWLLVIDNVENSSVINGFLPTIGSEGHTLITTRNPNTLGIPATGLEVDVLDQEEAVELLLLLCEPASATDSATSRNTA